MPARGRTCRDLLADEGSGTRTRPATPAKDSAEQGEDDIEVLQICSAPVLSFRGMVWMTIVLFCTAFWVSIWIVSTP